MSEVRLDFIGDNEKYLSGLTEIRDTMAEIRDVHKAASSQIQSDAAKNVQAAEDLAAAFEAGTAAVADLDKTAKQRSVPILLEQTTKSSRDAAAALSRVGDAAKDASNKGKELTIFRRSFGDVSGVFKKATDSLKKLGGGIVEFAKGAREGISDAFKELPVASAKATQKVKADADGLGDVLRRDLKGSLEQSANQFGVFGKAAAALGPIGIAVGAIGAGLLKVAANTDAGATALDGLGRTGGIVFDKITGQVTQFFTKLFEGESAIGKFASKMGEAATFIFEKLTPVGILLDKIGALDGLKQAAEDGQRLAQVYDTLDDAQTNLIQSNAKNERQINKLRIQLRDVTKSEAERLAIADKIGKLEGDRVKTELSFLKASTTALRAKAELELRDNEEINDATKRQLAEAVAAEERALQDSEAIFEKTQNLRNTVLDESQREADARLAKDKARADKRRQIEDTLTKDLIASQDELRKRQQQADIQGADPRQRVELERQAAEDELNILQQTLERKIALVELEKRIGAEAYSELSELQKQARADALIASGDVSLTVSQAEQIASLRLGIETKYFTDLEALAQSNAQTLLALEADRFERERQQLEIELQQREVVLRKAGATEQQIRDANAKSRNDLRIKQGQEAIAIEEQTAIALVNAQERAGQSEQAFERAKQTAILEIKIEAARKSLALIEDDGTKETALLRANLQATIAQLQDEAAKAKPAKTDLFALLGFDFTDAEKQRVQQGLSQILGLIQSANAAQQAEVQASISATDQIIADRQRRADDLRSQLDQELQLNEQGFASDVDLIRAKIAAEEQAEQEGIARRNALIQEQKKIAQQQLAIDAVVQASQLATAAAGILAQEGKLGVPGIIAALGVIASMIGAFVALRARARQAAAQTQQFEKGGRLHGPRHANGGMRIEGTNMEVEGGEYVTNRKATKKHLGVLEGINENKWTRERQRALVELLDSANVKLDTEATGKIVADQRELVTNAYVSNIVDNKGVEKRIGTLTNEVRGLRADGREVTYTDSKGRTVTVTGNKIIRRK